MSSNFFRICSLPVAPGPARDLLRMKADHDRETGWNMTINSFYRPRSDQVIIFERRYRPGVWSPYGDYRKYQGVYWGRIVDGGPAESPDANGGRGSNHTQGYAGDFYFGVGYTSLAWMRKNAHKYNFNNIEGTRVGENWHWCWYITIQAGPNSPDPWDGKGAPDPVVITDPGMTYEELMGGTGGGGGSSVATPINTINLMEEQVPFIYQAKDGQFGGKHYAIAPGFIKQVTTKESVGLYVDAHHEVAPMKEIIVSDKTFRAILGVNGIPTKIFDSKGLIMDYRTTGNFTEGGSWMRGDDESAKTTWRLGDKLLK